MLSIYSKLKEGRLRRGRFLPQPRYSNPTPARLIPTPGELGPDYDRPRQLHHSIQVCLVSHARINSVKPRQIKLPPPKIPLADFLLVPRRSTESHVPTPAPQMRIRVRNLSGIHTVNHRRTNVPSSLTLCIIDPQAWAGYLGNMCYHMQY